ncbi:hypothetical protein ACLBWS_15170 [Brucellaceae bacterium D45D]
MSSKNPLKIGSMGVALLLGAMFWTTGAGAQENGRYRLEGTENGYVRLDTRTGAISVCTEQQAQLVCKMATEDREAYENDIAALQDRVKKLEDTVAGLQKDDTTSKTGLPSEQEFEQSMSYMERFMRRFMDIAKSFDEEPAKPVEEAVPGRT